MLGIAQYYVYELSDPLTRRVFYVGKGKDKRIHEHEKEARKGVCSRKCDKIREIESLGLSIMKQKVAFFWDEKAAYEHEAERILSYQGLTNEAIPAQKNTDALSVMAVIKKTAGHFAYWLRHTKAGELQVSMNYGDDPYASLRKPLGDWFMNELMPKIFKEAADDPKNHPVLAEMFKPYGINLVW